MELNKNQDNKPKTKQERKERKMKKILTVSLFAIMAVGAANAEIASTGYVNTRTGAELTGFVKTSGDLNAAVNALNTSFTGYQTSNNAAVADAKKAGTDASDALDAYKTEADNTFMDSTEVSNAIANAVTGDSGALKDYVKTADFTQAQNTQDTTLKAYADSAAATAKSGAEKTAKDYTDEQLGALTGEVAAFESALAGKQTKSAAADGDYVLGGGNGAWQSIKALPAYCGTGHCALVSNDGTIEWEKVQ